MPANNNATALLSDDFGVQAVPASKKPGRLQTAFWDHLPAESTFMRWVRQLQELVAEYRTMEGEAAMQKVAKRWIMVGHFVYINHTDSTEVVNLLPIVAEQAGMDYWDIPATSVVSSYDDWKQLLEEPTPTLLHIEQGEWCDVNECDKEACKVRENLHKFMWTRQGLHPVVVVICGSPHSQIANYIAEPGQLFRQIALPELRDVEYGNIFLSECRGGMRIGNSMQNDAATVGAIVRHLDSRAARLACALAMARRAYLEDRPVEIRDLIEYHIYGSLEESLQPAPHEDRWRAAVHEAGHALAEILYTRAEHVPLFCSIVPRNEKAGLVMHDSIKRSDKTNDSTYARELYRLRVLLAGRVAEQLILGREQVSAFGASSDLFKASFIASMMVSSLGLPCAANDESAMHSNLLVSIGRTPKGDMSHTSKQARKMLADQYQVVMAHFKVHAEPLLCIADALMARGVLMQSDLQQLLRNHLPALRKQDVLTQRKAA